MLWVKALHIVFVTAWFAGLFYLPRILVNLAMEPNAAATARLLIMARKLYRFMGPLALLGVGGTAAYVLLQRMGAGTFDPRGVLNAGKIFTA